MYRPRRRGRATRLKLEHIRIPAADPVQYRVGWHVHLDVLAAQLAGATSSAKGCDAEDFLGDYPAFEPRYAAAATG